MKNNWKYEENAKYESCGFQNFEKFELKISSIGIIRIIRQNSLIRIIRIFGQHINSIETVVQNISSVGNILYHSCTSFEGHLGEASPYIFLREGTGTCQITWCIVMIKRMRGHSGKKIAQKSRNSCRVSGRGCGCTGTVDSGPKCAQS